MTLHYYSKGSQLTVRKLEADGPTYQILEMHSGRKTAKKIAKKIQIYYLENIIWLNLLVSLFV